MAVAPGPVTYDVAVAFVAHHPRHDLGGTATEVLADHAARLAPLTDVADGWLRKL
ncbi:hypothetical protein [Streptomyces sp. AK04-3B]|uniref:hypothetical protein n=1 Tax=unclassified Streptomyces TaxID=2593676 RepID=UPI0029ADFC79|nr:hypothetical protein [Streptomyces sp. AK04-3B]MDX3798110.1 hypothetical protein [Streptomyces sp. AK04-3B]